MAAKLWHRRPKLDSIACSMTFKQAHLFFKPASSSAPWAGAKGVGCCSGTASATGITGMARCSGTASPPAASAWPAALSRRPPADMAVKIRTVAAEGLSALSKCNAL